MLACTLVNLTRRVIPAEEPLEYFDGDRDPHPDQDQRNRDPDKEHRGRGAAANTPAEGEYHHRRRDHHEGGRELVHWEMFQTQDRESSCLVWCVSY